MTSESVVTLSVRRWNVRDHARFWTTELAPSLAAAAIGVIGAIAVAAVVEPGDARLSVLAVVLGTCGLAYPAAMALYIAKSRPPHGFDVVTFDGGSVSTASRRDG